VAPPESLLYGVSLLERNRPLLTTLSLLALTLGQAPTVPAYYHPVHVVPYATAQPAPTVNADMTGFVAILNGIRARHGLRALVLDGNLSAWAASNNAAQSRRGIGHFVMGPATRQNAAWNFRDAASVAGAWMASPGHRAAMLAREVTRVGIAYGPGNYWTANFR
jgi:uncharacterized protein YkwD